MKLIVIFITGLIIIGLIALLAQWWNNRKTTPATQQDDDEPTIIPDGECCGQHAVCERDSLLAGVSKKIEYYNDEELDRFKGISADQYPAEAIEEFREVLYTMHEEEVPGWIRSLQLRQIEIPNALKEEVFLIVGELRAHTSKKQ